MFLFSLLLQLNSIASIVHCKVLMAGDLTPYSLINEHSKSKETGHLLKTELNNKLSNDVLEANIVLLNGKKDVILARSEVEIISNDRIIVAGSKTCVSGCDRYNDAFLLGEYPYLDASVVFGLGSKLLGILPETIETPESLQNVLTDLYLSGSNLVAVDVTGETLLLIDNSNFKRVGLQFTDVNNTLILDKKKPEIIILSDTDSTSPSAKLFHEIGRYVGNGVTRNSCNFCIQTETPSNPSLFIVVYIEVDTPFISNILKSLLDMPYDKSQIELVVMCLTGNQEVLRWENQEFASFKLLTEEFDNEDQDTRLSFLEMFSKTSSEYFVYIDSTVHITPDAITQLLTYRKPIISPMLTKNDGTAWSNFWGSFTDSWSYKRSSDYDNIYFRTVKGVIPVACIRNMYIVQRELALDMMRWNVFDNHIESDVSFCKTLFEKRVPMFLANVQKYGWLKVPDNTTDLKLAATHSKDWNAKYINKNVQEADAFSSPCKNVFMQSEVFTKDFGRDLISALDSVGNIWKQQPMWHDRPGFHIMYSKLNTTLTNVILGLTVDVVSELYPGYTSKRQLYDSWIIEVEGVQEPRRSTRHDSVAAYHVAVILSDMGAGGGFWFGKQDCRILDLKSGDLLIFPGFITHQKQEWEPTEGGMSHFLEMSFDLPH